MLLPPTSSSTSLILMTTTSATPTSTHTKGSQTEIDHTHYTPNHNKLTTLQAQNLPQTLNNGSVPTQPFQKYPPRTHSQKILKRRRKIGRSLKFLWFLAPFSTILSVTSFLVSMMTSDWLRTEEKMPNKNRTILFGPNKSPEYLPKSTRSGMFELCETRRK